MSGKKRETRYHLAGWISFVLCAALFLFSALRDGDRILALASLVFLFGCILFLIPLMFPHIETGGIKSDGEDDQPGKAR